MESECLAMTCELCLFASSAGQSPSLSVDMLIDCLFVCWLNFDCLLMLAWWFNRQKRSTRTTEQNANIHYPNEMTDFIWFVSDTLFSLLFFFFIHQRMMTNQQTNKWKTVELKRYSINLLKNFHSRFSRCVFCCMYDVQTEWIYLQCPGPDWWWCKLHTIH